jgi:hypothetical protein
MSNMQLSTVHHLGVSNIGYLRISESCSPKTSFFSQKFQKFQSSLLSFEDIKNWKLPKDALFAAPYFVYQTLNY